MSMHHQRQQNTLSDVSRMEQVLVVEVEEVQPTHVLLHIQQASVAPMPTLPQVHQPLLTKHGKTLAHHLLVIILVRQDSVEHSVHQH